MSYSPKPSALAQAISEASSLNQPNATGRGRPPGKRSGSSEASQSVRTTAGSSQVIDRVLTDKSASLLETIRSRMTPEARRAVPRMRRNLSRLERQLKATPEGIPAGFVDELNSGFQDYLRIDMQCRHPEANIHLLNIAEQIAHRYATVSENDRANFISDLEHFWPIALSKVHNCPEDYGHYQSALETLGVWIAPAHRGVAPSIHSVQVSATLSQVSTTHAHGSSAPVGVSIGVSSVPRGLASGIQEHERSRTTDIPKQTVRPSSSVGEDGLRRLTGGLPTPASSQASISSAAVNESTQPQPSFRVRFVNDAGNKKRSISDRDIDLQTNHTHDSIRPAKRQQTAQVAGPSRHNRISSSPVPDSDESRPTTPSPSQQTDKHTPLVLTPTFRLKAAGKVDFELLDIPESLNLRWRPTSLRYDPDADQTYDPSVYLPPGMNYIVESMKTALVSERTARLKTEVRYNREVCRRVKAEELLERETDRRCGAEEDVAELRARVATLENARLNFDKTTAALLDVIRQDPETKAMLAELICGEYLSSEVSKQDNGRGKQSEPGQMADNLHKGKRRMVD